MPAPTPARDRRAHTIALTLAVAAALAFTALSAPTAFAQTHNASAAAGKVKKKAKPAAKVHNYLALGDSLAFGYQQAKFNSLLPTPDPAKFNTGYVDYFAAQLAKIRKRVVTTNLGCPGETTDSFLGKTPCLYHTAFPLHVNYSGSQMDAALAYLTGNPHPGPITLDIGANDLLGSIAKCNADPSPFADLFSCIIGTAPATFAHVTQNVSTILDKLRAASPTTKIIVSGVYNPLEVTYGAASDQLARTLNGQLAAVAAAHKARYANPLVVFNPSTNEEATLCALTNICTPLKDIHPTDAGYQQLGNLLWTAAGITRKLPKAHKKTPAGGRP